jgi:hypothetical protein
MFASSIPNTDLSFISQLKKVKKLTTIKITENFNIRIIYQFEVEQIPLTIYNTTIHKILPEVAVTQSYGFSPFDATVLNPLLGALLIRVFSVL